jgi:hypothetical protein
MLVYFSIRHVQFFSFLPFFLKNIQSFFGVSAGTDFSSLSGNRKKLVMGRFRGLDVANWWKHFIKKRFVISFIKSLPTLFFWLGCVHTYCKKFFSSVKVSSLQFLNHFTLNFPLRDKHHKLVKFYFGNIYIYNFTAQLRHPTIDSWWELISCLWPYLLWPPWVTWHHRYLRKDDC